RPRLSAAVASRERAGGGVLRLRPRTYSLACSGGRLIEISRKPYAFGTSHRLDEVEMERPDGTRTTLLRKDLRWSQFGVSARDVKPDFLYDPQREIEAYQILAKFDLGLPKVYETGADWFVLEKVPGVELWQIGDLDTWIDAAGWLARLHILNAGHGQSSNALLRYDEAYLTIWPRRAAQRHPELRDIVDRYGAVVDTLCAEPVTLIHGEFYPSNVIVAGDRIAPVDWEMSGFGPGVIDLA